MKTLIFIISISFIFITTCLAANDGRFGTRMYGEGSYEFNTINGERYTLHVGKHSKVQGPAEYRQPYVVCPGEYPQGDTTIIVINGNKTKGKTK